MVLQTHQLLQSIAIKQESYLKDTTDFNFIENTQIPDNAVLATLAVSSLYTNIPQEEGIDVVCSYYEDHYEQKLPIRTSDLRELMRLVLEENSFKFNEKHFVQTHGIAMGNKMAWSLSPLFSWWTWKMTVSGQPTETHCLEEVYLFFVEDSNGGSFHCC